MLKLAQKSPDIKMKAKIFTKSEYFVGILYENSLYVK